MHALHWNHLYPTCRCDTLQLLGKLTSTMNGDESSGNTTLPLCVPTGISRSELEYVTELFKAWKHRNVLKLTYVEERDYQINSAKSVRPLFRRLIAQNFMRVNAVSQRLVV